MLDSLKKNSFVVIGRAGMDFYADPPGTEVEHATRFITALGGSSANTAVARKLACRAWAIATSGQPYQPRDLDGNPITLSEAADLATDLAVPDHIRARTRGHTRQGRLNPT